MKSEPQISSNPHSPRSDSRTSGERRQFPVTDHLYQAEIETRNASSTTAAKQAVEPRVVHSFRNISNEFFGGEATADYVAEAVLFAWITCIAAWPIAVAIHQLTRWMI